QPLGRSSTVYPVQEQLEAYNARDLERFLSYFAPTVVIEDGQGNLLLQGHAQMRERYGPRFAQNPDLHCRTHVESRQRATEW
ncbi:MAG: nuclear transport factor 2 family protein, partial [Archangium sp.]